MFKKHEATSLNYTGLLSSTNKSVIAKNLRVLVNIWHIFTIYRGFISYDEFLAKGEAIDKDVLQKARANVSIDDAAALFVSSVSHKLSKQSQ